MKAPEILMEEHRVIERVLNVLETAAERLEQGLAVRPALFIQTTDFIKGFADGCHHKKEEGVLFPTLVAHGMPSQGGPIAVMLAEHEQGRAYTRAMRSAAQRLLDGETDAREELTRNARAYVALLRQHIAKEDGVLFPMANQVIPFERQNLVALDFEKVEHDETGEGVHEKYLALAQALEKEIAAS